MYWIAMIRVLFNQIKFLVLSSSNYIDFWETLFVKIVSIHIERARQQTCKRCPFSLELGGGCATVNALSSAQDFEVITADKAIDESNVGNRMLRNIGWQEGLGLGKDGSGILEPVQANVVDDRAGLGRCLRKVVDLSLKAQAGDGYKTIVQKKAIARFREMS